MKKGRVEKRDIISDLPDHLIVHIVSRLPTDEAVRTSVLSMRWKYLWKGIDRIILKGPDVDPEKFANVVEHVLENCGATKFLSFELACPDNVDVSRLNAWISRAFSSKIESLSLGVLSYFSGLPALTQLPKCVLSSSSLVDLNLHSFFDIQISESVACFPSLKILKLDLIFPIQCGILHWLLSACLVLENLSLSCHLDSGEVRKFNICVPTLEELTLRLEYQGDDDDESEYDITIDAPNLEYLYIMDESLSHYVVKNLSWIHHVDIMFEATSLQSLRPKHVENLLELLKGVAAAEKLSLHFHTMDVLAAGLGFNFTWPVFPNLLMLEVYLHNLSGWSCFPFILHTAPKLRVLILDLDALNNVDYLRDDSDDDAADAVPLVYPWITPDIVPTCLLEEVKIIAVKCVQGNEGELLAIEYLLKNARVLDRMLVDFHPNPVVEGLKEKILNFPRASRTWDVQVFKHVLVRTCNNYQRNEVKIYGI